jgi:hypothetical protein
MFLWWPYGNWLNIKIIYPSTIYADKRRLPKRGKYGKISGWEQVHKWVIKDLGRIPAWRRGNPGKLLSANRNTNWFKRILWEFQLGKGETSGLERVW